MPEYDSHREDYVPHHGVPARYEPVFSRTTTMAMIHYFQYVERLTLDEAIKRVDRISQYVRNAT